MAFADPTTVAFRSLNLPPRVARAFAEGCAPARRLRAGDQLIGEGDPSGGLHVLLDGFLKSCIALENGTAQTLALFVAGDLVGAQALALGHSPAAIVAVSRSRVASLPTSRIRGLIAEYPSFGEVLRKVMARENAILQQWMLGLGRRTALCQIAHLLCETAVRLRRSGASAGPIYDFPLTQAELADAAGLSQVHVNRVLQTLRGDGLIQLQRGQLRIDDWTRLAHAADFDPAYLGERPDPGDQHASLLLSSVDASGP